MKSISYRSAVVILIAYFFVDWGWDSFRKLSYYSTFDPSKLNSQIISQFVVLLFFAYIFYKFLLSVKPWNVMNVNEKAYARLGISFIIANPLSMVFSIFLKITNILVMPPLESIKTLGLENLMALIIRGLVFFFIPFVLMIAVIYIKFSEKIAIESLQDGGILYRK